MDEKLVIPQGNQAVFDWPFTDLSKQLEKILEDHSLELTSKEYMRTEWGHVLERTYYSKDSTLTFEYQRSLVGLGEPNSSLPPKDVTWFQGEPYAPLELLMERFKDINYGTEAIRIVVENKNTKYNKPGPDPDADVWLNRSSNGLWCISGYINKKRGRMFLEPLSAYFEIVNKLSDGEDAEMKGVDNTKIFQYITEILENERSKRK
jgi:hypothetical protein